MATLVRETRNVRSWAERRYHRLRSASAPRSLLLCRRHTTPCCSGSRAAYCRLRTCPENDLHLQLAPDQRSDPPEEVPVNSARPAGAHPFWIHSTDGEPLDVIVADTTRRPGAAFAPPTPTSPATSSSTSRVRLLVRGGRGDRRPPRDPYHRVDTLQSSRHLTIEADGHLIADTTRAQLSRTQPACCVSTYPARTQVELRGATRPRTAPTRAAASYWSVDCGGTSTHLALTYLRALQACDALAGLVCFFDEKVRRDRPASRASREPTPARRDLEESGVSLTPRYDPAAPSASRGAQ